MKHILRAGSCIFLATIVFAGCDKDTGKYTTGKDDPARKVTPRDIAKVEDVLNKQEAIDRAAGLLTTPTPSPEISQPAARTEGSRTLNLRSARATLPEGWTQEPPSSSMRIAQARIARSAGDSEDGDLSISYFEGAQDVQSNLDRWYGQFTQEDGHPSKEAAKPAEFAAGGMRVVYLNLGGTMTAGMPGAAPGAAAPKKNWRMLGAIVLGPQGTIVFKATGPDKTIADNDPKMKQLLSSLEPLGGGAQATSAAPAPAAPPSATPPARPSAPAQGPAPAQGLIPATSAAIDLGPLKGALPEGWQSRPPSNSMRAAELTIPRIAGDPADGELVVTYFGQGQGGSIPDNLARWFGQFTQPDGRPSTDVAKTEELMAGSLRVILLDLPGTMEASTMPSGVTTPRRENWRMLAAIVVSPQGSVFFKATGPDKTMAANKDKMKQFVTSVTAK